METVLGLSLTSTSVGWVLVEGRDADGAILDHDDFNVHPSAGVQAVYTSERASAAVLDAQAAADRFDQRLHVVGVTWSDESVAEAALLVESLTDAGYDNVVPVRLHDACDMLARAIAPVVGYDRAAVCVVEGDSTIVVMVDAEDGEPQTAIKQLSGGPASLMHWLSALFDRSSWQPGGIVVVGAHDELDALSARLESLPVPVITQPGVELALARGAALASAHSAEFADAEMLDTVDRWRQDHTTATRQRPYAGAVTILAAGAVTLVASVSLALGPHLVPNRAPDPVRPFAHLTAQAPVAEAPPPPAIKPPALPAPKPAPAQQPVVEQQPVVVQAPAEVPDVAPVMPPAPPPPVAPPPEPPPNPHPLLTKLLQRLHGQDPDQQPPPPPPGAPTP